MNIFRKSFSTLFGKPTSTSVSDPTTAPSMVAVPTDETAATRVHERLMGYLALQGFVPSWFCFRCGGDVAVFVGSNDPLCHCAAPATPLDTIFVRGYKTPHEVPPLFEPRKIA